MGGSGSSQHGSSGSLNGGGGGGLEYGSVVTLRDSFG
jgi:hypothetical protein